MLARALDSTKHGSNLNDTVMLASWPTPTVNDSKGSDYSYGNGDHSKICLKLPGAAKLTGWQTPVASINRKSQRALMSSEDNGRRSGGGQSSSPGLEQEAELATGLIPEELQGPEMEAARQRLGVLSSWPTPCAQDGPHGGPSQGIDRLPGAAALAGWATPTATELGNTLENYLAMKANMKSGPRSAITHLSLQAQLASWATPAARDYRSNSASEAWHQERAEDPRGKPLSEQVHQLAGSGPMPSGSPAETESGGQLNPELSRWAHGNSGRVGFVPPLAKGVEGRVGQIKAYGNAINSLCAATFIRAFMEATQYLCEPAE
jgi:hypothetical protein